MDRKTASEMLLMNESTISRSINKLIQRRIILKDETRNAYHLSMDRLALNNRVAANVAQATTPTSTLPFFFPRIAPTKSYRY